jgi:hypothetical protein
MILSGNFTQITAPLGCSYGTGLRKRWGFASIQAKVFRCGSLELISFGRTPIFRAFRRSSDNVNGPLTPRLSFQTPTLYDSKMLFISNLCQMIIILPRISKSCFLLFGALKKK